MFGQRSAIVSHAAFMLAKMLTELVGAGNHFARQVFERSAEQAGFFAHGKNRLVMPAIAVTDKVDVGEQAEVEDQSGGNGGGGSGKQPPIDPIIQVLLARLPKSGDAWPEGERKLWLQLLEGSFKLIYKDKAIVPPHIVTGEKPPKTFLGSVGEEDEAAN
jgi:hypothetical protein